MYDFAVVALLALATLKVVDYVTELVPALRRYRTPATFVLAIAATVGLDYSVLSGWGVEIRDADLGTWTTGFMVAGLTVPWRAIFGFLTHDRAAGDETLGEHTQIRAA